MDQKRFFMVKGGLNFLCVATGICLCTSSLLKLAKYAHAEEMRKEVKDAVEAIKTIDSIIDRIDNLKNENEEKSN